MIELHILCNLCIKLIQEGCHGKNIKYVPGHTWASFKEALNKSCWICLCIWSGLKKPLEMAKCHWSELECPDWETDHRFWTGPSNSWSHFWVTCIYFGTESSIAFIVRKDARWKIIREFPRWEIRPSTSSEMTLGQAYRWYLSCRTAHKSCTQLQSQNKWLPARLIDIGVGDNRQWKLRITSKDHSSSQNYMTLSYRWGTSDHIKLIRANFEEFCHGKEISHLPQTFKDAILVARRFSIRYLWIDSLCILQDSAEDWESQSLMMRYIYANSVCNISAIASTDAYGGLFRNREPCDVYPALIQPADMKQFGSETRYLIVENDYWEHQISKATLNQRGWVFQERMLAPRILYFGEKQIFWECFEHQRCEGFSLGCPEVKPLKNLDALFFDKNPSCGSSLPMPSSIVNLWQELVESYSNCVLTRKSDKLIAISGLANLFEKRTGDTYLAGVWRSRLPCFLAWYTRSPAKKLPEYIAPSWSWAAINSQVIFSPVLETELVIDILDVIVDSRFESTGKATGGSLILRALLHRTQIFFEDKDNLADCQIGDFRYHLQFQADITNAIPDKASSVSLLVLGCRDAGDEYFVNGLVLIKSSETLESYIRVGFFTNYVNKGRGLENLGISLGKRGGTYRVAIVDKDKLSVVTII